MDAYSDWINFEQWRPLNVEGMYNFLKPVVSSSRAVALVHECARPERSRDGC